MGAKPGRLGVGGNRQREKHAGKGNRLCQGFQGAWHHHGRKQYSRVGGECSRREDGGSPVRTFSE